MNGRSRTAEILNEKIAKDCLIDQVDSFLFDCDGVLWKWPTIIPGSIECVNLLKSKYKKKCFFVTNNSTKTRKMYLQRLITVGVENVEETDIVCTAWILATYLKSKDFDKKVFLIGNESIASELDRQNIQHVGLDHVDYHSVEELQKSFKLDSDIKCVAVGLDFNFSYSKIMIAATYAMQPDCLFLATNTDAGTLVKAIATCVTNKDPVILGKPSGIMFDVLKRHHNLNENRTCMIGDRLDTDIAFGNRSSLKYTMLVLSGITSEQDLIDANNASGVEADAFVPNFYCKSLQDFAKLL